jgi:two-component system sensor histidine kinase TctE
VYYSVHVGRDVLTGYADLPRVETREASVDDTRFAYASYRGSPIRLAAVVRRVPRVEAPVVVQVAETLDSRSGLQRRLLAGLFVLEVLLIVPLAVLVPLAVRWGLRPLAEVRREIDSRSQVDFTPLTLQRVPAELRSFVTAFNGLLLRLQDAVEGIRRFTADASHQMRTPLSILRAHLQVLQREGLQSAAGRASLADIDAATLRLQRLLTQLLALARAEGSREGLARLARPVDLVAVTRSVAEDYVPVALRAGVDLQFEADASVVVSTVEALVRELIANLVDNAIRYNRAAGTVWLRVDSRLEASCVVVEDDGPGIPESMRAEVFKRFRRLERDRGAAGSGLGLAIVKVLADALGADVRLGDGHQGGLRVEIVFPAAA